MESGKEEHWLSRLEKEWGEFKAHSTSSHEMLIGVSSPIRLAWGQNLATTEENTGPAPQWNKASRWIWGIALVPSVPIETWLLIPRWGEKQPSLRENIADQIE